MCARVFFEHHEFFAVRDALLDYLKGVATFAYKTEWRCDEIFSLEWSNVDLQAGIVTINVGESRNDDGRTVHPHEELKTLSRDQWLKRKEDGALSPYVFPNPKGTRKISDPRFAWASACEKAKIGHRLFHDFRLTAVRNMARAGIPVRVAMQISGHKTRSVFDRYNIVSDKARGLLEN